MVIQSGERSDKKFIDLTLEALRRIKRETRNEAQPDGFGVTLCIGQQSPKPSGASTMPARIAICCVSNPPILPCSPESIRRSDI